MRGAPHRLHEAIRQHSATQLFTSGALLEELAGVLTRPFAAERLALIGARAAALLVDYTLAADVVTPLATTPVIAADADDDHVIAAAVTAQADLIVSGDRHLLDLATHQGIRIVSPTDALRLIADAGRY